MSQSSVLKEKNLTNDYKRLLVISTVISWVIGPTLAYIAPHLYIDTLVNS